MSRDVEGCDRGTRSVCTTGCLLGHPISEGKDERAVQVEFAGEVLR